MRSMIAGIGIGPPARVMCPASRPSRSTVTRSQIWLASSRRWVTNMIATPSPRSRSMMPSRRATSDSVSAEVGSSMMISRDDSDSARAISTSCCSATDNADTGVSGSTTRPTRATMARASSRIRRQSTRRRRLSGARPTKMFSATLSVGISDSS